MYKATFKPIFMLLTQNAQFLPILYIRPPTNSAISVLHLELNAIERAYAEEAPRSGK